MAPDTAGRAISLIDLTSLKGGETAVEIEALCRRAVAHADAAVCVYAEAVPAARPVLAGSAVRLATVANFPYGGDDIAAAAEETAAAVAAGADEVDVVAPIGALLEGDIGLVGELIEACRAAAGPDITLKVILETGALREPDLITAAARAAVMAGVDFLKTSTGKIEVGATLEARGGPACGLPRGRRAGRASRLPAASVPPPTPRPTSTSPTRSWARTGRRPGPSASAPPSLLDDLLGQDGARTGY